MVGVEDDDITQGCVKMLLSKADVRAKVGHFPAAESEWIYYIFQDKLLANMERSPESALVISDAGGWGAPNTYNTMEFIRLSLEIYCGPIRDPATNAVIEPAETRRRMSSVYNVVSRYLHRTGGDFEWWGTVRTISSVALGTLQNYDVPDGDGLMRGQAFFGVTLG